MFVIACGAPPRVPAARVEPPRPAARDLAIAEPAPKKAEPELPARFGERWVVNGPLREPIVIEKFRMRPDKLLDTAASDYWTRCVRDYVQAQPDGARRALTEMLDHYITTCDADGRVVLARPLGPEGRERPARSDLTF